MGIGQEKALALRADFNITDVPTDEQIDSVLRVLGVVVVDDYPFAPNIKEVYVDGVVGLARGLSRAWKRWCKAHALAHHVLHDGNQFRLSRFVHGKQERQANEFAAYFLLGDLRVPSEAQMSVWHLAEYAGVPVEFVRKWLLQVGVAAAMCFVSGGATLVDLVT